MLNHLKRFVSFFQEKVKKNSYIEGGEETTPLIKKNRFSLIKPLIPIWIVSLPLSGMLMCAIGAITTIYTINGQYLFHLKASAKGLELTLVVDKKEIHVDEIK